MFEELMTMRLLRREPELAKQIVRTDSRPISSSEINSRAATVSCAPSTVSAQCN